MKINFTPKKIYVKFLKSNLMTKISVYYITILCISIALASMAFNSINSAVIVKKTSASAQQTLEALDQNLSYLVSNVSQFSSYVFFDNNVQSALKKSHRKGIDPSIQDDISKSLVNMILSSDDISSAFLFDNYNNSYYMSRITGSKVLSDDVKKASWYNTVEEAKGYPVWVLNDGQLIQSGSDDMPVSLVRMVYSTDDYKPIGVLVMNINKSFGNHIFSRLGSQYKSQFFIVDSNGNYITQNTTAENTIVSDFIKKSTGSTNYAIEKIDGQKVILTSRKSSCSDWRIIGIMPMSELSKQFESTGMVILLIILINVLFLCIGQIYVTKIITKPLSKMKKYMAGIQNGNFQKIPIELVRDDEIVELKRSYNIMVEQIQKLIQKVKDEQRQLRLSEISIVRAQINPHFLYNTLDAVSALALIKDNESAYTITQALENFYRISLSSGKDVITVEDEIKCIKSYVQILNIRYKDSFNVIYEIDDGMLDHSILKLILQPFVENAITHGVRNKHGRGTVTLKGHENDDNIVFEIEDDGAGMTKEKIEEIISKKDTRQKGGFGIYSSITRISLFYGVENPVSIESTVNEGTKVTLNIPKMSKEDMNGSD